jgi:hypothetical protein
LAPAPRGADTSGRDTPEGGQRLDGGEKLQRMADLIRARPDITSRQLADLMGYAEVKSIYYWLEKNGFTLRTFRNAVLLGEWPPGQNRLSLRERVPYGDPDSIPILAGFDDAGDPLLEGETLNLKSAGVRFALRWQHEHQSPLFERGDLLLLSDRQPGDGEAVLVQRQDEPLTVFRLYRVGKEILLVDACHPRRSLGAPLPPILAVVAGLLRPL